jgi:F-type H+-transporting ATPase subunit gamma
VAENSKDLKRRIRSVTNTSQLTRAMKMVSAAKLRRAQEQMMSSRPYDAAIRRMMGHLVRRVDADLHPLLAGREEVHRVDLVVITGDKGLCGAFNSNVIKRAETRRTGHESAGRKPQMVLLGKKGCDYYRRRPRIEVVERETDISRGIDYTLAAEIAEKLSERFISGETDRVELIYNRFKSTISQTLRTETLIPLGAIDTPQEEEAEKTSGVELIFEPDPAALMEQLVPRFVSFALFQAMLESIAAEHGARMAAMENATRAAKDMIDELTLRMNRARQAAITTEIIEVVSGAEAL